MTEGQNGPAAEQSGVHADFCPPHKEQTLCTRAPEAGGKNVIWTNNLDFPSLHSDGCLHIDHPQHCDSQWKEEW